MKTALLKRERINHILSAIYDYPLTIVEAPMGFGKTTAVRNFFAAKKCRLLWITFLNTAQDATIFWHEFAEKIGKLDQDGGIRLKSLGLPADAPQTAMVLSVLNKIEFKEKTVVVIDDYHLITNMQINNLLLQIASEKMDNLHIVIITRDTTNINFGEMYLKGMCHVISQQQLKFTDSEIRDYCLMMDNLSEADLRKISEYTGGWISLIYMILLGLKKGIPVGINNTIDELLEKALFNTYEESIREILLKLSVMDSFTSKKAAYVTREEKTHEILKRLQRENAFVYYDEANKTYKIHNVLLDFLRTRQNFEAEELKALYRRLGEWHLDRGEIIIAYSYLNRAGDVDHILAHLNSPANIRAEIQTQFESPFEMIGSTSQELLDKYPIAYLQLILMSILKGNEDTISECAKRLDNLQQAYEHMEDISDTYRNRIVAEACIIRKLAKFNHLEESSVYNEKIVGFLNGGQSYIMVRENEFTFGSPHLLYTYLREQGTFKKILQIASNSFPVFANYSNGCGTGSEYLAHAEYGLETGDWQSAELNSYKAIYKARTKNQYSIIICANFNLIRLYIFQGKINESVEMLKQLEKEIIGLNNPIYNTTIDICKGYIYACLDRQEKIPLWLQTGDMTDADFFYQGIAFNYLVYGKAVLVSKNYVKLEMLAESFIEYFSMFSNQLGFIHNGIFEATAKYQLYGLEAGIAALETALAKGEADGILMPFVENSLHIIKMLEAIANNKSNNEFVKRVLFFSRQYKKSLKSMQLSKVSLTQREKEVLSLAAEGLTREEIAASLYMSQGTVKTHMQNIYQKLEVGGKVSAIKIAQMNGLI